MADEGSGDTTLAVVEPSPPEPEEARPGWIRRRTTAVLAAVVLLVAVAIAGILLVNRKPVVEPPTVPKQYQALVLSAAATCPELRTAILAAQLAQESGWDPLALSAAGAQGIAQFMPATWKAFGVDGNGDGKVDITDPNDAIPAAARYDCALFKEVASVPGDPTSLMLAAYNAGPTKVRRYNGIPPFTETQSYVRLILARAAVIRLTTP